MSTFFQQGCYAILRGIGGGRTFSPYEMVVVAVVMNGDGPHKNHFALKL